MEKIISPIKNELKLFEENLFKIIDNENNFLKDDLKSFIFSNPKRLRPIFIFLFAKLLKIDDVLIQKIATITELLHSASLIHDDIIDEEEFRRNNKTFYCKFGSKLAVLEGDLLLSIALNELSNTTLEILKIYSLKIKETINGEIEQNSSFKQILNKEKYINKTFAKTGNLFLAGLESLFTIKQTDKQKELIEFMKNYSIAFQIKNDVEDFKNNYSDFKNGNYTMPVIYYCMENSIDNICENVDFTNCINKTKNLIEIYKNKALEQLSTIENNIYKNSLIELTNYTLRS